MRTHSQHVTTGCGVDLSLTAHMCVGGSRSFVQAAAAAQAGVSVISPNVGRINDFYQRNPGAIRDPRVGLLSCVLHPENVCLEFGRSMLLQSPHAITKSTQGPRQDAGTLGQGTNPGIGLVQRIYNHVQQATKGHTKVMVSGVRTSKGEPLHPLLTSSHLAVALMPGFVFLPADGILGACFACRGV